MKATARSSVSSHALLGNFFKTTPYSWCARVRSLAPVLPGRRASQSLNTRSVSGVGVGGGTALLLSGYGVAGFLDGALELLSAHPALVIGDLDGALLDIRLRVLHPGELVQLAFDGRLAV